MNIYYLCILVFKGSHHDNLDDIRLQDLSFNSQHSSAHDAFIKVNKLPLHFQAPDAFLKRFLISRFITILLSNFHHFRRERPKKRNIWKSWNITRPKWWVRKSTTRKTTEKKLTIRRPIVTNLPIQNCHNLKTFF